MFNFIKFKRVRKCTRHQATTRFIFWMGVASGNLLLLRFCHHLSRAIWLKKRRRRLCFPYANTCPVPSKLYKVEWSIGQSRDDNTFMPDAGVLWTVADTAEFPQQGRHNNTCKTCKTFSWLSILSSFRPVKNGLHSVFSSARQIAKLIPELPFLLTRHECHSLCFLRCVIKGWRKYPKSLCTYIRSSMSIWGYTVCKVNVDKAHC